MFHIIKSPRVWLLSTLLAISLFIFPQTSKLHGETPPRVQASDIAFQPLMDYDAYIQAWNFTHIQKGLRLYITFIVSNMGPGSLNNGVSVLIFQNGKTKVITAEYTGSSLTATPGQVGIKSGHNYFKSCGPGCYDLAIKLNSVYVKLDLKNARTGYRMSHKEIKVSDNSQEFVSAYMPVESAVSTGKLNYDGTDIPLNGISGMEFLLTNKSPHQYAKSISLLRSYGASGVFLGYMDAVNINTNKPGRVVVRENGKVIYEDYISRREVLSTQRDHISGIALPALAYYYGQAGNCRIKEKRGYFQGGFFVLNSVSSFLRWLLKTFFAKPYILYYQSKVSLECKDKTGDFQTRVQFPYQQSSSYIINE